MSSINLRPATMEDAELLLAWRNDPKTREQSRNSEEISLEQHVAWLAKSLALSTRKIYLAEQNGELIGTVRSDKNEDGRLELSWTVAPPQRGKGLGKAMVLAFVKLVHPTEKLMATIKKGNISSEKIAQALGLRKERGESSEVNPFVIWKN